MALNLDKPVQKRRAGSDGAENACAARRAGVDTAQVGVVHYIEHVAANLEGDRVIFQAELEVTHQAPIELAEIGIAQTVEVKRQDARLVGAKLRGRTLVPTRCAGLARRNHGVPRTGLSAGQNT